MPIPGARVPNLTPWRARLRAAALTIALLSASLVGATAWSTPSAYAAANTVSGTVHDAQGQPLADVVVEAWVPTCGICDYGRIDTTSTDAQGRFSFDASSEGWDYGASLVLDPPDDTFYLRTAYPSGRQPEDGALQQRGTDVSATLTATGGAIAGTVTADADVRDTVIRAISTEPDSSDYHERWTSYDIYPAAGPYRTGGIPAGSYYLGFCETEYDEPSDDFAWCRGRVVWWPGVADQADATPIAVTDKQVNGGKNAHLTAPARVSNTGDPTFAAPQVGKTVTASPGAWTPSGVTFTYRWSLGEETIPGATSRTYTPRVADLGKQLSVRVEGTKEGYLSGFGYSTEKKVAPGQLVTKVKPKVSGTPKVGKKVQTTAGTFSPRATSTFQWYANGKAISKATKSSLTLTRALKGKTVTVKVTAKATAYRSTVVTLSAGKVR